MEATDYYRKVVAPKRPYLTDALVERVIAHPEHREVQSDGRIRLWARMSEFEGRVLRVVLLADGRTVLNAFLDRGAPLSRRPEGS